MTIEEWAAEMFRRAKSKQVGVCDGCPSGETCYYHAGSMCFCNTVVAAWHEAGVVPVVTAPGERREG